MGRSPDRCGSGDLLMRMQQITQAAPRRQARRAGALGYGRSVAQRVRPGRTALCQSSTFTKWDAMLRRAQKIWIIPRTIVHHRHRRTINRPTDRRTLSFFLSFLSVAAGRARRFIATDRNRGDKRSNSILDNTATYAAPHAGSGSHVRDDQPGAALVPRLEIEDAGPDGVRSRALGCTTPQN